MNLKFGETSRRRHSSFEQSVGDFWCTLKSNLVIVVEHIGNRETYQANLRGAKNKCFQCVVFSTTCFTKGLSRFGTRRLSPEEREMARLGNGIRVPMVEARFLRTKLKRNGPELSEAMEVPAENVESRKPPEEER